MDSSARLVGFVGVADLDTAQRFYGEVLGLDLSDQRPFALVGDVAGTRVRITSVESVSPQPYTVLGWQVDDIDAAVDDLAARGVQFLIVDGLPQDPRGIWTAPGRARIAWFHDPDENVLSLQQDS